MDSNEQLGRRFREAWIAGVRKYFPGEPKAGYVAPWEEMGAWEQRAATTVWKRTAAFVNAGLPSCRLTPEQGGRYVSEAWNVEVFRNVENPKPSYVSNWDDLPEWQRRTDIDIYATIERTIVGSAAEDA